MRQKGCLTEAEGSLSPVVAAAFPHEHSRFWKGWSRIAINKVYSELLRRQSGCGKSSSSSCPGKYLQKGMVLPAAARPILPLGAALGERGHVSDTPPETDAGFGDSADFGTGAP